MREIFKKEKGFTLLELLIVVSIIALISSIIFLQLNTTKAKASFVSSQLPLFNTLDDFVLFVSEEIKLENEVQVSSGNLGSNKEIDIQKNAIINGNLFAAKITIDKNAVINGNVSFNKLKTQKETKILGTQTKPVPLPIANLPEVPDFQVGTQDFKFEGEDNALVEGNYRDIVLEENSRLVLSGGVYNLRKLELKKNSTIIYSSQTTLNIKEEFKGQQKVSLLPDQNLKPDDLMINYLGKKGENIVKPIEFGKNSFLNFKLLAPKASIHIGKETTLRGQVLAKKIKIEKDSILSKEDFFEKESDPTKIVEELGVKFVVNEIIILFESEATQFDAQQLADLVDGRITGFISTPNIYKIEVQTVTTQELEEKIQLILDSNNPFIIEVIQNLIGNT